MRRNSFPGRFKVATRQNPQLLGAWPSQPCPEINTRDYLLELWSSQAVLPKRGREERHKRASCVFGPGFRINLFPLMLRRISKQ